MAEDDIAFLSSQDLVRGPNRAETCRIIQNNEASLHALQLNSNIGTFDGWEKVTSVRIEGNRASSHSIQLNYPLSMDAFVAVMQAKQAMAISELSSREM